MPSTRTEVAVAIIGGGQSALAVAYFLRRTGRSFVITDAEDGPGAVRTRHRTLESPARGHCH